MLSTVGDSVSRLLCSFKQFQTFAGTTHQKYHAFQPAKHFTASQFRNKCNSMTLYYSVYFQIKFVQSAHTLFEEYTPRSVTRPHHSLIRFNRPFLITHSTSFWITRQSLPCHNTAVPPPHDVVPNDTHIKIQPL